MKLSRILISVVWRTSHSSLYDW